MDNSDLMNFDDQVGRYFKNEMSEDEKTAFLEKVNGDKNLKERMDVIALLIMSFDEEAKEETSEVIHAMEQLSDDDLRKAFKIKERPKIKRFSIRPWVIRTAAACAVCLVVMSVWLFMRPGIDYRQLGADSYGLYSYDLTGYRGAEEDLDITALSELFNNVRDGRDLESSINALEKYRERSLEDVSGFNNYILWNLAMAYLKTDNVKAAKDLLERLSEINRDIYPAVSQKADEVLQRIND